MMLRARVREQTMQLMPTFILITPLPSARFIHSPTIVVDTDNCSRYAANDARARVPSARFCEERAQVAPTFYALTLDEARQEDME